MDLLPFRKEQPLGRSTSPEAVAAIVTASGLGSDW